MKVKHARVGGNRLPLLFLVAISAVLLSVFAAACGDSDSDSASTASTGETTQEESSASSIPYDGPEKGVPTEYPEPEVVAGTNCTIGFQNIYAAIPSLAEGQKAAEAEAANLGCKFVALDDQLTPTNQVNNFNQLLSQNVSAIIVYPIVPDAMAPSIAKANAAGVPVMANNTPPAITDPLPEGYVSRVLQGYDSVAYQRVKYIAEQNPGAEYATLGLAVPVASLQYLNERTKYWGEKFGLKFAGQADAQDDSPAGASTAMSGLLGKYPDLDVVFAYNDNAAVAASTVVRSSQAEVEICGANGQEAAFQGIEDGTLACTVLIDFVEVGRQLARGAYTVITDAKAELPETVIPPPKLVDQSTVASLEPIG